MSIEALQRAWRAAEDERMTATQHHVLLAIADRANDIGEAWPRVADICKRTRLSERSVRAAIQELTGLGWIQVERREDAAGRTTSSLYLIGGMGAAVAPRGARHAGATAPAAPAPAPTAPGRVHVAQGEGAPAAPSYIEPSEEPSDRTKGEPAGAHVPGASWQPGPEQHAAALTELRDTWPEFKRRAFSALGIDSKAAGQLELWGGLLPNPANALLLKHWSEAYAAGRDSADLLVLADWLAAGALDSVRSDRPGWLVRALGQHLSDARVWDEQGRTEMRRRGPRSPPAAGLGDERDAKDEAARRRAATQKLLGGEP